MGKRFGFLLFSALIIPKLCSSIQETFLAIQGFVNLFTYRPFVAFLFLSDYVLFANLLSR